MPVLGLPSVSARQQLRIFRLLKSKKIKYPESSPLCFNIMQQLL